MYVRRLQLDNLRTFAKATLGFQLPSERGAALPNVTLIVGTNGAGKSTVLRAVALAAIAPVLSSSGYVPRSLARRTRKDGPQRGAITADFDFTLLDDVPEPRWQSTLSFIPPRSGWVDRLALPEAPEWSEAMWEDQGPGFFVVGYGASRRVESSRSFQVQEKERHPRFLRVASLFEDSVVLRPLSSWLPLWDNPGRRKQTVELLNQVIGSARLLDQRVNDEFLFEVGGAQMPFDALSDGYRAFIGWVADLLYHVTRGVPSGARLDETAGIALVDEIDLHMHPQWQREVLPRLARALPRMQFICTTHSPLVIGSVHRQNVLVLKEQGGATRVEPAAVEVHGLSSDQILTSPYFGLDSTRAPEFESKLKHVAQAARDGDADQARQYLRMLTLGERAVAEAPAPPPRKTKARPRARPARKGPLRKARK